MYSLGKGALLYSRNRERLNEALVALGLDAKEYGLHGLRSGGLISVVHHSGNSSRKTPQLQGRCKTGVAKDMYVQERVHSRLKISSYLGL